MKKYELLENDSIVVHGKTLYRIKAVCDFGLVENGQIGGYIEKESNLSHFGECWVYDNAKVYGEAKVYDNAKVFENAIICDNVKLHDNVCACNHIKICGDIELYGSGYVYDIDVINFR